jgi:hypothetical protein
MLERAPMRGGVDTAREPRGDDETFEPEFDGKLAREFLSRRGAIAGADDGDDGKGGELGAALDVEQGRGRIDMGERRRIARLAERDEICADCKVRCRETCRLAATAPGARPLPLRPRRTR